MTLLPMYIEANKSTSSIAPLKLARIWPYSGSGWAKISPILMFSPVNLTFYYTVCSLLLVTCLLLFLLQFFTCNFYKRRTNHKNYFTFSFDTFATLVQSFKVIPSASPKILNLNQDYHSKKVFFLVKSL